MANRGDQNSSVRNTKKRIREGFICLLREKPLSDIRVSELTKRIELNRGTFYCHYQDVFDLARQLEDGMLAQLPVFGACEKPPLDVLLRELFSMLREEWQLAQLLLSEKGDIAFLDRIRAYLAAGLAEELSYKVRELTIEDQYLVSFLTYGVIGIARSWLDNGMEKRLEELVQFTVAFVGDTVKLFLGN